MESVCASFEEMSNILQHIRVISAGGEEGRMNVDNIDERDDESLNPGNNRVVYYTYKATYVLK